MYKLILSYDILNEKGESVLKDNIINAASYEITEADAHGFCSPIAKGRISQFLEHFLATGFLSQHPEPKLTGIFPEVIKYNYELCLPSKPIVLQHHHTNTTVSDKIVSYAQSERVYNSVVKPSQDE